jgi:hypothetical protein
MEPDNSQNPIQDEHRVRAGQALQDAQANPVLSGEQSCAVAHVHALLAIERRLGQLCASLDAAIVARVYQNRPDDRTLGTASPSLLS